ncbi:hypothetical protein TNCV_4777501 [Trichonephila clavipes]|nr:hypothetical protein TNCV_4777501 [Trichonephila clavipes]
MQLPLEDDYFCHLLSYIGSPGVTCVEYAQDADAYVRHYGRPIILSPSRNPAWDEIQGVVILDRKWIGMTS